MMYMLTLKTACYSEETVEFNVLQIFGGEGVHCLDIKIMTLITFIMIDQDDNHNNNVDDCKEDYDNSDDNDHGICDDDDNRDGGIGGDEDDDASKMIIIIKPHLFCC